MSRAAEQAIDAALRQEIAKLRDENGELRRLNHDLKRQLDEVRAAVAALLDHTLVKSADTAQYCDPPIA